MAYQPISDLKEQEMIARDQAMQQQQSSQQQGMYDEQQYGQQTEENIAQWQLEFEDTLERIEHYLKGERIKVENRKKIWKQQGEALLNEKGINEIMRILSMYLDKSAIMGNIKIGKAHEICKVLSKEIADMLKTKYKEFDLDPRMYKLLIINLDDKIFLNLTRPVEGRERDSLRKMMILRGEISNRGREDYSTQSRKSLLRPGSWFGSG